METPEEQRPTEEEVGGHPPALEDADNLGDEVAQEADEDSEGYDAPEDDSPGGEAA